MDKRLPFIEYIANADHYNKVIARVSAVKRQLWIGTADIKDLYVKRGSSSVPFVGVLDTLTSKGVEVRLIHAKEPGAILKAEFDNYPLLLNRMERCLCPRVHFKLMIFDLETVYIGSANLTGAGIGMKSDNKRNFEAGVLTNVPTLVKAAIEHFDKVWMGAYCKKCGRKQFCGDKII